MSFIKNSFLAALLFSLWGCGFKPLYGPQTTIDALKHDVAIQSIANREGQLLRNRLVKIFGQKLDENPKNAVYILEITLKNNKEDIGLLIDDTSTFSQYSIYATYKLKEKQTKKAVLTKSYLSETSYNQGLSPIASLRNEQDAKVRLTEDIAHKVMRDVSIFLQRQDK